MKDGKINSKYIIALEIEKNGLDLALRIKACEKLEKFFSGIEDAQVVQSSNWRDVNGDGLYFYTKTENTTKVINDVRSNFVNCFVEYGAGLYNGSINVAVLRTKNISKGIKINVSNLVSFEELKKAINDLGSITKYIYANYIAKSKIKAKITYEI